MLVWGIAAEDSGFRPTAPAALVVGLAVASTAVLSPLRLATENVGVALGKHGASTAFGENAAQCPAGRPAACGLPHGGAEAGSAYGLKVHARDKRGMIHLQP